MRSFESVYQRRIRRSRGVSVREITPGSGYLRNWPGSSAGSGLGSSPGTCPQTGLGTCPGSRPGTWFRTWPRVLADDPVSEAGPHAGAGTKFTVGRKSIDKKAPHENFQSTRIILARISVNKNSLTEKSVLKNVAREKIHRQKIACAKNAVVKISQNQFCAAASG